jgi:hypothetical protein
MIKAAAAIATIMLVVPAAEALECKSQKPKGVYASYRLIDGRKCWYAGKHQIAKSKLHWHVRVARVSRLAKAPKQIKPVDVTHSTQSTNDAFEQRWQLLAPIEWGTSR